MSTSVESAPLPAVILIDPQLSENIGTAARAMMNCAFSDLPLVRPRDGWLTDRAIAASAGADTLLNTARIFSDTAAAIADLQRVYATTGRNRFMVKRVMNPREAVQVIRSEAAEGLRSGILFGPERTGLENDDVALADCVIMAPLNPGFSSLNLAQAVLIVAYEHFQAGAPEAPVTMTKGGMPPADKGKLVGFFEHLERELDACGFFRVTEKRPGMVRNIRNMFERAGLTDQEVRTLHGIVHELVTRRTGKTEPET